MSKKLSYSSKQIAAGKGVAIASAIIILWFVNLTIALAFVQVAYSLAAVLLVLIQTHLYTGIFITAHDAMHGTVSLNKIVNKRVGQFCTILFAYNSYSRLLKGHQLHHRHAGTDQDPDHYHGSFFPWYISFLKQYVTWWQIVLMAITYNLLKLWIPDSSLILFWIIPSILSTFQLFYFGTYQPHKGSFKNDDPHKSTTISKNHIWAFVSCYFFGYHIEHHEMPYLPWWSLHRTKQ